MFTTAEHLIHNLSISTLRDFQTSSYSYELNILLVLRMKVLVEFKRSWK